MLILLPNHINGLKYLEKHLLDILHDEIDERMHSTLLSVAIPKFRTDASFDAKKRLKEMGVKDLFDPGMADLRGISKVEGLHVSKIFHRTSFQVNERGSRASAATGNTDCFKFTNYLYDAHRAPSNLYKWCEIPLLYRKQLLRQHQRKCVR